MILGMLEQPNMMRLTGKNTTLLHILMKTVPQIITNIQPKLQLSRHILGCAERFNTQLIYPLLSYSNIMPMTEPPKVTIRWTCPKCNHKHEWKWSIWDDIKVGEVVFMICDICKEKSKMKQTWAFGLVPVNKFTE